VFEIKLLSPPLQASGFLDHIASLQAGADALRPKWPMISCAVSSAGVASVQLHAQ
jgi:hypothetical protein